MFDLKVLKSVLTQLEEERGITAEQVLGAIEDALAHAYRKEYGKRGQIIKASFDVDSGTAEFEQVKTVVDEDMILPEDEEKGGDDDERIRFNPEQHMMLADAKKIKKDVEVGDDITFPLETQDDFGRIAAQTAKQVMIQKIREAEKEHLSEEFGKKEGEIVTGSVQRIERGNIFVDLGRATGILPYEEQIPGERYKQGERVRAYLYHVEENPRGVFLKLSRSHPQFLERLFEAEAPEVANETVEIKAIAREAGSRSKVAVYSYDEGVDPVGSLVGQRGVRVSTVMSELGGEKIDIIEWSDDAEEFIEEALSPAKVLEVEILDEEERQAEVTVSEDQQSLAIGRGGQNVRLAAKLTGWRIDIQSLGGDTVAEADEEGDIDMPDEDEEETTTEEESKHDEKDGVDEPSDDDDDDNDEESEDDDSDDAENNDNDEDVDDENELPDDDDDDDDDEDVDDSEKSEEDEDDKDE